MTHTNIIKLFNIIHMIFKVLINSPNGIFLFFTWFQDSWVALMDEFKLTYPFYDLMCGSGTLPNWPPPIRVRRNINLARRICTENAYRARYLGGELHE